MCECSLCERHTENNTLLYIYIFVAWRTPVISVYLDIKLDVGDVKYIDTVFYR